MFLSIIVAVYNIESYLKECLNSIVSSCNGEVFELILVVGDSKDNSNKICEEYQRKYNNITVLKQIGKGLSDARNCGMNIANGEFVMFVDGDDYILTQEFQNTLKKLKFFKNDQFDVLVSDYYMVNESNKIVSQSSQIEDTIEPIRDYKHIEHFMKKYVCFWNVWRYIYRREFLINNNIIFKENSLSEDIDYTTKVFMKAENVLYYHNPYYCYRVGRKNSLMNVVNIKRVSDTIKIIESNVDYILKSDKFGYKELMIRKFLFEYILNIATIYEVPIKDRIAAKKIFKDSIYILNKDFYHLGRVIYRIIGIIGIEPIAFCLLFMKKVKRTIRKLNLQRV